MLDSVEAGTAGQFVLEKVSNEISLEIVWSHTDKGGFGVYPTESRQHLKLVRCLYTF